MLLGPCMGLELETWEMPGIKTWSPPSTATHCLAGNHKARLCAAGQLAVLGWTWCWELQGTHIPSLSWLHSLKHYLGMMGTFILSNPFICMARLKRAINAAALWPLVAQPYLGQGWGAFGLWLHAVAL